MYQLGIRRNAETKKRHPKLPTQGSIAHQCFGRQDGHETCKVFCTTLHISSTLFVSGRRGGHLLRQPFLNDTGIENVGLVLMELDLLRQNKAACQRSLFRCTKRDCTDIGPDGLLYDGASQTQKLTNTAVAYACSLIGLL